VSVNILAQPQNTISFHSTFRGLTSTSQRQVFLLLAVGVAVVEGLDVLPVSDLVQEVLDRSMTIDDTSSAINLRVPRPEGLEESQIGIARLVANKETSSVLVKETAKDVELVGQEVPHSLILSFSLLRVFSLVEDFNKLVEEVRDTLIDDVNVSSLLVVASVISVLLGEVPSDGNALYQAHTSRLLIERDLAEWQLACSGELSLGRGPVRNRVPLIINTSIDENQTSNLSTSRDVEVGKGRLDDRHIFLLLLTVGVWWKTTK